MLCVGGNVVKSHTYKGRCQKGQAQGSTAEGRPAKPGFSQAEVDRVIESGGQLAVQQALCCRVRYFSDSIEDLSPFSPVPFLPLSPPRATP